MGIKRFVTKKRVATEDENIFKPPQLVEALEPRLLLSADTGISGITSGFNEGLDALGDSLQEYIETDTLFDTYVPGVLELDPDQEALVSRTIEELLRMEVDGDSDLQTLANRINNQFGSETYVTFEDYFVATFVDRIEDFMTAYDPLANDPLELVSDDTQFRIEFSTFLNGALIDADVSGTESIFDLDVSSSGSSLTVDEATWELDFNLTINRDMVLDLGAQADDLEIFFPGDFSTGQTTEVEASFDFSLTLGFDLSDEEFFVTPDGDVSFTIDTHTDTLTDADLHVGFLGTSADGTFSIDLAIGTQMLDPSTPNFLGFTEVPPIDGEMIIADIAPRSFDLEHDINIEFNLKIGTHDMVPIDVTLLHADTDTNTTIEDLKDDLQTAIGNANAALGELVVVEVVEVNGEERLALRVIDTDAEPVGFNNESYVADPNVAAGDTVTLTAAMVPAGDGATIYEFTTDQTFLLSVDGSVPYLVTLPATDPAMEELGFAQSEAAVLNTMEATNAGPVNGQLGLPGDGTKSLVVVATRDTGVITVGILSITEPTWIGNANLTDLSNDLQTAINGSALTGLVTAGTSGGKLKFDAVGGAGVVALVMGFTGDEALFGFTGAEFERLEVTTDSDEDAVLTGDATFDIQVNPVIGADFMLTVVVPEGTVEADYVSTINTALAATDFEAVEEGNRITIRVKQFSVHVIEAFDVEVTHVTKGNTTIGDLASDLDRALKDLGLAAVDGGDSGGKLTIEAMDQSLEITRTLGMDFDVNITTAEMQAAGGDIFLGKPDPTSTFEVDLTLTPDAGLSDPNDSNNPYDTTNDLKVLFNPFDDFDSDASDQYNPWELRDGFVGLPDRLAFRLTDGDGVELITGDRASLIADDPAPDFGRFLSAGDRDLTITLSPDGGPVVADTITIAEADWETNNSLQDLANDINDQITASLALVGLVVVTVDRGRLRLNPTNSPTGVKVSGTDETDFGFANNQESETDTEFDKFLAFNVLNAHDMASLIGRFGGFLDDLASTDFMRAFEIAFAQADLGQVLDFGDLIFDTLLINDMDDGLENIADDPVNDVDILMTNFEDGGTAVTNFVTAQDMALILNGLYGPRTAVSPNDVADTVDGTLTGNATFDVDLDGTVHHITVLKLFTDFNNSVADLATIINFSMLSAGMTVSELFATADGNKIKYTSSDDEVGIFTITATNAVAENELGLGTSSLTNGSLAKYDDVLGELTYDLELNHTFVDVVAPINFDLDDSVSDELEPLFDIFSESMIEIDTEGHLNAIFGVKLGDSSIAISEATPLADLNDGSGVQLNDHLAITSATPITTITGRLTDDAVFDILFTKEDTTQKLARVTVLSHFDISNPTMPYASNNTSIGHLVADINNALTMAIDAGGNGIFEPGDSTIDLTDYIQATHSGGVISLEDVPGGSIDLSQFHVETDTNNPAYTELLFQTQSAATQSLIADFDVVNPATAGLVLTIKVDRNAVFTDLVVTVDDTGENTTVTDLVNDINAAIALAEGGEAEPLMVATRSANRITFHSINSDVDAFEVNVSSGSWTDIGLANKISNSSGPGILTVNSAGGAPVSFGVSFDRTFDVIITGGTLDGTYSVTVAADDTIANRSIYELAGDVNSALDAAFLAETGDVDDNPFRVVTQAGRIVIGLKTEEGVGSLLGPLLTTPDAAGITGFDISGATGKLNLSGSANLDDLVITTSDGTEHGIVLDTLPGTLLVGDVMAAINTQTSGDVTVEIGEDGLSLKLIDNTYPDPTDALFSVRAVNGSPSAFDLGIFGSDINDVSEPAMDSGVPVSGVEDGIIRGAQIASIDLLDRFFIRETGGDFLSADLTIHTPSISGIEADAIFGFVGVHLDEGSSFTLYETEANIGLIDPESTVRELIDGLDSLHDSSIPVLELPTLHATDNDFSLNVAVEPLVDALAIALGGSPTVDFTIDLGAGGLGGVNYVSTSISDSGILTAVGTLAALTASDGKFTSAGNRKLKITTTFGDGETITETLTITEANWTTNTSLQDLVDDINAAVIGSALEDQLISTLEAGKITLNPDGPTTAIMVEIGLDESEFGFISNDIRMTDFPEVSVGHTDLDDLANFDDLRFEQILAAMKGIAGFFDTFASLPFLNEQIPLLGVSFNEVLSIADKFGQAVEDLELNPAASMQELEQKIREAFNLPDFTGDQLTAYFENLGIPNPTELLLMEFDPDFVANDVLKIDLRLPVAFTEGLPISLDLGNIDFDGPDPLGAIDIQGQAGLSVEGYLDAKISVAVNLSTLQVSLYEGLSELSGSLTAAAENITFNAAIGPLGALVKDGVANANIGFEFKNATALDTDLLALPGAFGGFSAMLTGGDIEATLPVYFPTEDFFLGDITLAINETDISDLGNWLSNGTLVLPDFSDITLADVDPFSAIPLLIDGLDLFLATLQDILDGDVFGFELPIIGDKLSAGAEFIEDLRKDIIDPIRQFIEEAPELGETMVQHLLFAILGPGSAGLPNLPSPINQTLEDFLGIDPIVGLNLLKEFFDGDAISGPFTQTDIDEILPFSNNSIEWRFRVGETKPVEVDIDFDIGFPGLGLDWDTPLNIDLTWDLAFGIGVSDDDGAYLIIDNERMVGSELVEDELYLEVDVTLDNSANITGELGFLQLTITPNSDDFDSILPNDAGGDPDPDETHFDATFGVNLIHEGDVTDDKLGFSELGELGALITLTAEAEVNLGIVAEFNKSLLPDTISAVLPSVIGDFVLDWSFETGLFNGETFDIGNPDNLHLVAFNEVGVDMGSFLSDFLGPFVEKIQEITEPLQPIIDIVTSPIPVISDLAGQDITLLDLAAAFGDFETGMIYAIADLITFVNSIPSPDEVGALILPIGTFTIIGPDNEDTDGLGSLLTDPNFSLSDDSTEFSLTDALPAGFLGDIGDVLGALGSLSPGDLDQQQTQATSVSVFDKSAPGAGAFAFPIFENPTSLFGLLLGRDVTLITYDLPPFGLDFSYLQKFMIWGPLWGRISLGFGVEIDLAFGYDTRGIREFAAGDFTNPLDLIGGFYIADTDNPDGSGSDVPELILTGSLAAGAELNAGVASAGVDATVTLTVNFDLYDPDRDGKVRIDELVGTFLYEWDNGSPALAPIAIFDVFGDISLQMSAFIEILGVVDLTFDITPKIVLFEFSIPFDREPILATERGDGSLLLHIGANSLQRLNGDTSDGNEEIHVASIGGNKVKVWGMGVNEGGAQEYEVKSGLIVGSGGQGNDIIDLGGVMEAGFTYEIEGGTGDDTITTGKGSAVIHGDDGDDTINAGEAGGLYWDDEIYGGSGNDIITGGGGRDIIFGDGGRLSRFDDDTLFGLPTRVFVIVRDSDGVDEIDGDGGDDVIFGGGHIDHIEGGDGADLIIGDGGKFEFKRDNNNNPTTSIVPVDGDGRVDVDQISSRGEGFRDKLFGNAGNDTILGGAGNDHMDGGADDDQMYGGVGFDTMYGGSGLDRMFGELNDDIMFGFRDPEFVASILTPVDPTDDNAPNDDLGDIMEGGQGNDYMRGNQGDDEMFGGRGADIMFGDEDNDTMFGESGGDVMFGGADNDTIDSGDNNDIVFGDDGLLVYYGFYTNPARITELKDDRLAVDDTITGSLIRITAGGDRLIGDGATALMNDFGDFGSANGHAEHSTDDGNDRTLDLIVTDVKIATDGDDNIIGGNANDIVLGGAGDDTIFGDWDADLGFKGPRPAGEDVLIGDGGRVEYQLRRLSYIATIIPGAMEEGIDTISGNDGDDYIFGGASGDFLYGYEPIGPLFGDVSRAEFKDLLEGITDNDIVLGDNGEIVFFDDDDDNADGNAGTVERISTTDTVDSTGGDDTIEGYRGDDILIGGVNETDNSDMIFGNLGDDIILGDNGFIDFGDDPIAVGIDLSTLDRIHSEPDGIGGGDYIEGNAGQDVIMGGNNGDIIHGYGPASLEGVDVADVILGDNGDVYLLEETMTAGEIVLFGSAIIQIITADVLDTTGGGDDIHGNIGNDIILGGVNDGGVDNIYGDEDDDVILGDNGQLDFANHPDVIADPEVDSDMSTLDRILSHDDNLGGRDIIRGEQGEDTVMGGTGGDDIHGDDETASHGALDLVDTLIGDNGKILLSGKVPGLLKILDSSVNLITTIDTAENTGGADLIEGNALDDIILGGVNDGGIDVLAGDAVLTSGGFDEDGQDPINDIILGDNGLLDYDTGDADLTTLDVIKTFDTGFLGGEDLIFGSDGADIAMGGTAGDNIYGDFYAIVDGAGAVVSLIKSPNPGSDTALMGDGGEVILVNNIIVVIKTIEVDQGGADMIQGNDLSDKILGGFDGDLLYGETDAANQALVQTDGMVGRAGDDWMLGDNGRFDFALADDTILGRPDVETHLSGTTVVLDPDSSNLDRVMTTDPIHGGADVMYGNGANDTMFGGTVGDMMRGDTSDAGPGADGPDGIDLMFGDHGKLYPTLPSADAFFINNNFFSIDTQEVDLGLGDVMFGNANNDIMLGGQGDDVMFGGTGDDDMIGGHNVEDGHDDLDTMPALDIEAITPNALGDLNPSDVNEINDIMDGGDDDDVMAGDNAYIIRQLDLTSPRFRLVAENGLLYTITSENLEGLADVDLGFEANVTGDFQDHQDMTLARTVQLLNHDEATEDAAVASPTDPRPFGNDIMAGGLHDDEMWGQLGDDIMQGDGAIVRLFPHKEEGDHEAYDPAQNADPSFDLRNFTVRFDLNIANDEEETARFNVVEHLDDGDDYMEGNGGNDRMYGNLGQDDIIGGSSTLFGLDSNAQRPDGADLIYGGAGNPSLLERNASIGGPDNDVSGDTIVPAATRHGFDADVILGDNGDIFRIVKTIGETDDVEYESFNYDVDSTTLDGFVDDGYGGRKIRPRAVTFADYGYSYEDVDNDNTTRDTLTFLDTARGEGDLIYGETGDDIIFGMTGNDLIFGGSEHDDLYGNIGTDFLLGGTGIDGIMGDEGLLMTRRNDLMGEPLYGIAPRDPDEGPLKRNEEPNTNSLNVEITSPGNIQRAVINIENELIKQVEVFAFRTDDMDGQNTGEFNDSMRFNDIIFGGLQNDFIHGGDGDDAISGAEALPVYYSADPFGFTDVNTFLQNMQSAPPNGTPDLADNPFWFAFGPYNPGEILRYEGKNIVQENGQRTRTRDEFAWYDEFNPRRKIMFDFDHDFAGAAEDFTGLSTLTGVVNPIDFLLNFDEEEGPDGPSFINDEFDMPTDGADRMFGDLGNDWLVGGTGRDHMYGGRGDDMLNMDDNHDSGASDRVGPHDPPPDPIDNTLSDEFQAYADIVYSGAGRDIMILNTGADRAIDWVGEFNSYVVPFSPFGAFHISRSLQPQLPEFLEDLAESDGADVRADDTKMNNVPDAQKYVDDKTADVRVDDPDPERNFEPYGELGMVRQTDFAWSEQTGAPNDPQPGNFNGKREIMRRQLFNDDGTEKPAIRFAAEAGTWEVSGGTYNVTPEFQGQESVSIFHLDMYQPGYMEILVTINTVKAKQGYKSNGFVIFDYQSATDFKFAGIDVALDKIQIGHFDGAEWVILSQLPAQLKSGRDYDLTVVLHGTVATLWVNQLDSISYDFGDPLNDDGLLGLATDNAKASFDDFQVQQLPPVFTFQNDSFFSNPETNPLEAQSGEWTVASGELTATLSANESHAVATQFINVASYSLLNIEVDIQTDSFGGIVFDYYSSDDFKFVAIDAVNDQIVVGHYTGKAWVIDAAADFNVNTNKTYTLGVSLFGTSVSVTVDNQSKVGHVYNSILNDGAIGLLTKDAQSIFDNFVTKGDDPYYLNEEEEE
jgi:Ca2+-binding RTX toxin-like protein